MADFFISIYNLTNKHKYLSIILLLVYLAFGLYMASRIKFSEDITKALPDDELVNQSNFVFKHSRFLDKIVINISAKDTTLQSDSIINFAGVFADSLKNILKTDSIAEIKTGVSQNELLAVVDTIYEHLPVFMADSDFYYLSQNISSEKIKETVKSNFKSIISPVGIVSKKYAFKDPFSLSLRCSKKFKTLNINKDFELYNDYVVSKNHKNVLLFILPKQGGDKKLEPLIVSLRKLIAKFNNKSIKIEYFGAPAVALANSTQIKTDIKLTLSFTLVLLLLIITYVFRQKTAMFSLMLPVALGGVTSLIFISLTQQSISAISLGIGSVLLGISVDYSLHIYSHIRETGDIKESIRATAMPVIISSLTTVSAFLVLLFINSPALHDLALFAAISVISAAFFSLVSLPHLVSARKTTAKQTFIDKIANIEFHKNKYLIISIFVLTVFLWKFSGSAKFEANLDKLNFMPEDLAKAQENINKLTGSTGRTVYLISFGNNFNEALSINDSLYQDLKKLKNDSAIKEFVSISSILKSKQNQIKNIRKWSEFWKHKRDTVKYLFETEGNNFHFKKTAYSNFFKLIDKKVEPKDFSKDTLFNKMFLRDFIVQSGNKIGIANIIYLNKNQNTALLRQIQNKNKNIWLIDRRATVTSLVSILNTNFKKLLNLSLIVVFLILLLSYGRIELAIAGMIPIMISWVWVLGIMGLFGLSFNIVNIIIVSFIFGLGVDYSVFITNGILYKYKYGKGNLKTYRFSVLLSVLTTLLGIGALIFAKHPALKSIALLSVIGISSTVLISFTVLPLIINWLIYNKGQKRDRVVTLFDFFWSIMSLIVFVLGAVLLNIEMLILKSLFFIKDKKRRKFFHYSLKYFAWFLIYMNFFSKKRIINEYKENFKKPAIIIANHQSHIDLMLVMLLTPNVVILTNKRNYTNKIYGSIVRYAGFINADESYEEIARKSSEIVRQGYSIMIFPEGTRSDSGKIKRFHKGAVYMAENLNLEILPLVFHGANKLLRKHEFFLKRGTITIKILKRINLNEQYPELTTRERTKELTKLYRKEFQEIENKYAQTDFYRSYIIKNFIYKGPVLEWYTKIKISLENNYRFFNDLIPKEAVITDIGCGYGYLDFMLSLCSKKRIVTGIDYDEEKITVARNCAIKSDNQQFIAGDALKVDFQKSDVFILNDVLHYMPKNMQKQLLVKCFKHLNTGGMLIVRDGDTDKKSRQKGTWLTELFSTKIVKFNKTQFDELDFLSESFIRKIAEENNFKVQTIDKSKLTSNTVFILTQ